MGSLPLKLMRTILNMVMDVLAAVDRNTNYSRLDNIRALEAGAQCCGRPLEVMPVNLIEFPRTRVLGFLFAAALVGACGKDTAGGPTAPEATAPAAEAEAEAEATPEVDVPETGVAAVALAKWTGDLDAMIERRYVRVLTTYSRTHFFNTHGF
jgi:hypothetical protein